ncbi:GDSL-type esterase/lipase family protein [Fictibacillus barbaricus]|uniref:Lysophospholipase L1-like esterase n=1 Tax=Fictibacillus barbaricus TaxID=182136 RepID=A0ABU1TYR3_9BACL|nr:GDSL-type esterase/lipase family protein [Fictibacillus barbaricus]MDR7072339.1 lysophospholipase L1-like esterase [Fictibacillus barbaricus]
MPKKTREFDWILTAIGDSLTVGVGAPLLGKGYVGRYVSFTEELFNKQILVNNFAITGLTSKEILNSLRDKKVIRSIRKSKMILITAGGNDLIQAGIKYLLTFEENPLYEALNNCKKNINKIFKFIFKIKRNSKEPFLVRICSLYNPYSNFQPAVKWVNLFNKYIKTFEKFPCVKVGDLYDAFKGREKELVSFDTVHPNKKGYQVIAVVLYELGFSELE